MSVNKRIFLFLIILFCSVPAVFSQEKKQFTDFLSFRITPQFELSTGVINEYVFDTACKNTDNKESQLDWNIKTLAVFNLQANFDIIRYGFIGLSISATVPQRSDFMQDYDWLNSVTSEWKKDDPTELTNFSEHLNYLDKFIDFKVSAGGNIYLPLDIKITPHVMYKYEFIRFTASNGYIKYKSDNFTVKTSSGKVISYEQEINSFFFGLNLNVGCIPRTLIDLSFDISPMMTKLNAIDYHYINQRNYGTAYLDSFTKLMQIESSMIAQYRFSKYHSAGISGRIQYIPLSKGNTSSRNIDKKGNYISNSWVNIGKDTGGTERFIWSLGLNYSFSL